MRFLMGPWAVGLVAAGLVLPAPLRGEEATVPVAVQMDLLAKLIVYDRNLANRGGDQVVTLILVKSGHDESARAGAQALRTLGQKDEIALRRHAEELVTFVDAATLAQSCRTLRASVVYVTPGFSDAELSAIGRSLTGISVISAGAVASSARKGLVLSFDLVSGKPKLLIALGQAEKQQVSLSANVLRLMQVLP
ncbi:MAG: DUF4154 domain-containing protein [Deltaproteobacteria bacterium]|nr:DUF4154 domain-containing protein [Deltaproteobacteria bacterium]